MAARSAALLAAGALLLGACRPPGDGEVRPGSRVRIHYRLVVDGRTIESTEGEEPALVELGRGQALPGLEEGLVGLQQGQTTALEIPPEKGYGSRDPAKVRTMPRERFKGLPGGELKPGMRIHGLQGGAAVSAEVLEAGPERVRLDFNHPLAGKTLRYEVVVVGVE